jgi:hypothetical protein
LLDGAVSVRNFAADLAELTTDAGPATQRAINHAADTGARAVYWPALPGGAKYYYPMTSASLVPPTTIDMEFFGDGMRASHPEVRRRHQLHAERHRLASAVC